MTTINQKIKFHEKYTPNTSFLKSVSPLDMPKLTGQFDLRSMMESINMQNVENFYTVSAHGAIYSKVSSHLKTVVKVIESMRSFYLVDAMLTMVSDDALEPKIGSDEVFNFSCEDKEVEKELNKLKESMDLDQMVSNIAPDILAYGEYSLRNIVEKGKGIIDVSDSVDQGTVVSLYSDGAVTGYLALEEETGMVKKFRKGHFTKFTLAGSRLKTNTSEYFLLNRKLTPTEKSKLYSIAPRFVRVGKSMLYPVISKIKELELLDKLVPATKLNQLSQGNLVGMTLPDNFSLDQALEAVQRLEGMVNKKVGVDPVTGEITIESILSTAGRTKILPLFGDKGSLSKLDYKADEPNDMFSSNSELRSVILDSIGIPSELLFRSDSDNKLSIIRRHSKYIRKLKNLQKCISAGLKSMAYTHLINKGMSFKKKDINVVFNNTLVEVDKLDKLEYADVTLNYVKSTVDFFNSISEENSPYKHGINFAKIAEHLDQTLSAIGLVDAFDLEKFKLGTIQDLKNEVTPEDDSVLPNDVVNDVIDSEDSGEQDAVPNDVPVDTNSNGEQNG